MKKTSATRTPQPGGAIIERRKLLESSLGALGAITLLTELGACSNAAAPNQTGKSGPPPPATSAAGGATNSGGPTTASAAPSATPQSTGSPPAATQGAAGGGAAGTRAEMSGSAGATTAGNPPDMLARVPCELVVPTFPAVVDSGPGTTFTVMDNSNTLDWAVIGSATAQLAAKVPDGIINLLHALDKLYVGYPISVLQHSLQVATRAMQANASDDLVLCALCHDLGMAITVEGHAELSASILRGYVSESAYRVVRHHTELEWQHAGAPSGQPHDQRTRYNAQPWFADAARFVDEWEVASYDPKFSARTLDDFTALVRSKFSNGASVSQATAQDCFT
jgi:predicted HD phosphohydrolase